MLRSLLRISVRAQSGKATPAPPPSNAPASATSTATPALPPGVVEITVDGRPVRVPAGTPLIQACAAAGVDIPRFCYHERLAIAGNCRMCLVEVERTPKPVASCAMPASNGMKVHTASPMVKKAREGVMEFLLSNHPLDCPICDQGGECDLQDQSMAHGSDRGRYMEPDGKRAVEDKNLGPLVKTVMTRCIHCTRCVRFANEVAGFEEFGTTGRGNDMQIGTYIERMMDSELSGNIIDLCPVGALTSKPYEFKARPWELRKTESIDCLDAVGSSIRVDTRGLEVMRVLPRLNEAVNEEWLDDRSRFAYDGLKRQRLMQPMVRRESDGLLLPTTWQVALTTVAQALQQCSSRVLGLAGQLSCAESQLALRELLISFAGPDVLLSCDSPSLGQHAQVPSFDSSARAAYVLNSTIASVEDADAILLIGTYPRHEAALVNSRIRKAYLRGADIAFVGPEPRVPFNYDATHLGNDLAALIATKQHSFYQTTLSKAQRPLILVGSGVLDSADAVPALAIVADLAGSLPNLITPTWRGIGVLHRDASRVSALDLGYKWSLPRDTLAPEFVYLLGADQIDAKSPLLSARPFVVYQGHHGDAGSELAHVILPGAAYTEKDATFANTEGRVQRTRSAVAPLPGAREDWRILRALSSHLSALAPGSSTVPFDSIGEVQQFLGQVAPVLGREGLSIATADQVRQDIQQTFKKSISSATPTSWQYPITDYYLTNSITRASATMARCSRQFTFKEKPEDTPSIQSFAK